ncbi:hypothetical protein SUGI_0080530 [Cryptomeria japonica]|nr:hypothetical protein SUGI_0080530 [Cryptomeria japonica]
MGNIIPSHSSPLLSHANQSFPSIAWEVFINHRGRDKKRTAACFLYHKLRNRGFNVFFDKSSIRVGEYIPQAITCGIQVASVHAVILSPNYAQSQWCLDELLLIIQTGAPIVPVFWGIQPSEVRMANENGVYAKAFEMHKRTGKFNSQKLEKWKNALRWVSLLKGFISEG